MKKLSLVAVKDISSSVVPINVNIKDLYDLCHSMSLLCSREDGIGLSAVQVGIPWNIFVYKKGPTFEYFIDCDYTGLEDNKIDSKEGCLSLRKPDGSNRYFMVKRYKKVRFFGKKLTFDKNGNLVLIDIDEIKESAIVEQHEIDHAKNILISEIGKEIFNY